MMHKSCKFQIKNGRISPHISNVEKLITYNQQYNILENSSQLIVETDISLKTADKQYETIKHQTLIELIVFNHELFEIDDAVKSLMWNLRHNIFEKIKEELHIIDNVDEDGKKVNNTLKDYFPNDYNDKEFSCELNKDLRFDDYNFQPPFNLNLLTHIHY